jgi:hypothetical protein
VAALNIVLHSIESAGYGTVEVANGPDRQANPQQVTELIAQLKQTLADYNTDSSRVAEELSRALSQGAQQQAIQAVLAHVEAFDFEEALAALKAVEEMQESATSNDD